MRYGMGQSTINHVGLCIYGCVCIIYLCLNIPLDKSCPRDISCPGYGVCSVVQRRPEEAYFCSCPSGYTGTFCNVDIDDCDPSPCENGVCRDIGRQAYNCTCDPGYTGVNCETDIDYCSASPCVHGTCQDQPTNFVCTCDPGFTGHTCDADIDDCSPNPCQNGGNCTDTGTNSFVCTCTGFYTGLRCENDIDECLQPDICGVNERCTNTDGGFSCECLVDYERKDDDCVAVQSVGGLIEFDAVNGIAIVFTIKLNNAESPEYKELSMQCYLVIYQVFSAIFGSFTNWELFIVGFSSGSVVAEFEVKIYNSNRDVLRDQAEATEAMFASQDVGLWVASDGSTSLSVEAVMSYGQVCLSHPCLNGECRTNPGTSDFWCECTAGYTGPKCESEITCPAPKAPPSSHVVDPKSEYQGGEFVQIACDQGFLAVVWQCNGTSGSWINPTELVCDTSSGVSTSIIIGIVVAVVAVAIIAVAVSVFLYKRSAVGNRARPTTQDRGDIQLGMRPTGNNYHPGYGGTASDNGGFNCELSDGVYMGGSMYPTNVNHEKSNVYDSIDGMRNIHSPLPIPTESEPRGAMALPPSYSIRDPTHADYDTVIYDQRIEKSPQGEYMTLRE